MSFVDELERRPHALPDEKLAELARLLPDVELARLVRVATRVQHRDQSMAELFLHASTTQQAPIPLRRLKVVIEHAGGWDPDDPTLEGGIVRKDGRPRKGPEHGPRHYVRPGKKRAACGRLTSRGPIEYASHPSTVVNADNRCARCSRVAAEDLRRQEKEAREPESEPEPSTKRSQTSSTIAPVSPSAPTIVAPAPAREALTDEAEQLNALPPTEVARLLKSSRRAARIAAALEEEDAEEEPAGVATTDRDKGLAEDASDRRSSFDHQVDGARSKSGGRQLLDRASEMDADGEVLRLHDPESGAVDRVGRMRPLATPVPEGRRIALRFIEEIADRTPDDDGSNELTRDQRRSRRSMGARAQTLGRSDFTRRKVMAAGGNLTQEDFDELDRARPKTRADCIDGPRPCPFVSCKWNLFLDVREDGRAPAIKLNFPDREPHEMRVSCALDIIDAGGTTLEVVGSALNITRERVRQIVARSLSKIERKRLIRELGDEIPASDFREKIRAWDERRSRQLKRAYKQKVLRCGELCAVPRCRAFAVGGTILCSAHTRRSSCNGIGHKLPVEVWIMIAWFRSHEAMAEEEFVPDVADQA